MPPIQRWDGRRHQGQRRPSPIIEPLRDILFDTPGLTCDGLLAALQQQGISVDLGQVRTVLRQQSDTFVGHYAREAPWDLSEGARQHVAQHRARSPRRQAAATRMPAPVPVTAPQRQAAPAAPRPTARSADPVVEAISGILGRTPNLTKRDIARKLRTLGISADPSAINSKLYRHEGRLFAKDVSTLPRWRLIGAAPVAPTIQPAPRRQPAVPTPVAPAPAAALNPAAWPPISLYDWQRQALDAWEAEGRRGIVEAVTGTGKTRVGMMAIREALATGGFVHVLVPTIDLQEQWCRELEKLLPGLSIGRRGNDRADAFPRFRVIVSVVNSARDYAVGGLPPQSLLVADECHRYGADGNAKALREEFQCRLGLTATFARDDGGCEAFLAPYFGDTCFQMGYAQAIEDEVTAHFKVALVGVDFATEEERQEYDAAAEQGGQARHWLIAHKWAPAEPFGEFMKHVASLRNNDPVQRGNGDGYSAVGKAREYMKSFSTRRKLLASTTSKRDVLVELIGAVRAASRTIVFTESIETANDTAVLLRQSGIRAAAIHSKMTKPERKAILGQFARGEISAIAAPKVLDEGIDVPAADLAIIFATSKTRRQMVQRMGRVLRRKTDGRLARFIVLYVEDTTEDPGKGAHETFIGEIADPAVAEDIRTFDSSDPLDDVVDFLNDFSVDGGQPPARMA